MSTDPIIARLAAANPFPATADAPARDKSSTGTTDAPLLWR